MAKHDDDDDGYLEWERTPEGRRKSIPDEVKQHIEEAIWQVVGKEAQFLSTDPNAIAAMMANLESAGISHEHSGAQRLKGVHKLTVPVDELNQLIPEWRDLTDSKALAVANKALADDAKKRETAGRPWREGILSPDQSIMFCQHGLEVKTLIKLLDAAHIKIDRQGEGNLVLVAPTHALQRAGIDVKMGGTEVVVESEEKQQADARDFLTVRAKWEVPAEGSKLARADFRNQGSAEVAVDHLRMLGCTTDLKRLPDARGRTVVVDAKALRRAVPDVSITPFSHTPEADGKEDDRCSGR